MRNVQYGQIGFDEYSFLWYNLLKYVDLVSPKALHLLRKVQRMRGNYLRMCASDLVLLVVDLFSQETHSLICHRSARYLRSGNQKWESCLQSLPRCNSGSRLIKVVGLVSHDQGP